MKIGIFGGSFDPPHKEHINIAKNAVKELNLDRLFLLPAFMPPHKPKTHLEAPEHRFNMLNLAIKKDDGVIKVSDYELKNPQKSYTYVTIEHFKNLYPDSQIYFLIGGDMLENFPHWKNPESILKNATLFVTQRSGEDLSKEKEAFYQKFKSLDGLIFSGYIGKKVSSTDIRNRLILGLDTFDMIDEKVKDYIDKNNLYSLGKYADYVKKSLPIRRLTHTLGVMNLAEKYAKRLNCDVDKAVLAAMLHDVAKYLDYKVFPDFKLNFDVPNRVIHQFLGAYIAENILGITDHEVINAIKYHTTGRPAMTLLEKIVFTADLLEEGRTYEEVYYLRDCVEKDFEWGFKMCVKLFRGFLLRSGQPIYSLSLDCYNYYINDNQ